jgi:hypothetical protein
VNLITGGGSILKGDFMDADKNILVKLDTNIADYQTFFEPQWLRLMNELTDGTKLAEPVLSLGVSWFTTANAYAMPWRMVQNLIGFEVGFIRGERTYTDKILARLATLIPQRMEGLSNMKRQQLADVIKTIGAEYDQQVKSQHLPTDAQALFESLLTGLSGVELQTSIVGSQKLCYNGLYYAYEEFLRACVGLGKVEADYRVFGFKKLEKDAKELFGDSVTDHCLSHELVKIARFARNALAHNGGKLTDELKALTHDFPVDHENTIHIVANHNRNLYSALKGRAYKIAEAAHKLPQCR